MVLLFLRIWSYLLKKSLMENFIFCVWETRQVTRLQFWNKYYTEGNFCLVFLLFEVDNYIVVFVVFFIVFPWKSRKFICWCKLNASLIYKVMYWYVPQVLSIFLTCSHNTFCQKVFLLNVNPTTFVKFCNVGKWFEGFWSTWDYKFYWYRRKGLLKTLWNYLRWSFFAKIVSAF